MRHIISPRVSKLRRKVYLSIPEWVRKRDFELFTALLCFLAGIPLLLTQQFETGSMEAALPNIAVSVWAFVLAIAPIAIVVGIWQSHRHDLPKAIPWIRCEASGLRLLAYVAYLYGVVIILVIGAKAGAAPFIIFIFALTCHSRSAYLTIKVEDYFNLLKTIAKKEVDPE